MSCGENLVGSLLRVCLEFAYFAETENFFTESIVDKGKN